MKLNMTFAIVAAVSASILAPCALLAEADVTGLVPTIWLDFETKPSASQLQGANKGSSSITFSNEGTMTYQAGATNGWALDTSRFTPYSARDGVLSTAGNPFTVSVVMTLGTTANGIALNVRTSAGDLIIRRGADTGSLVIGFGSEGAVSTSFLNATFADGDAAWHLVSVVGTSAGTELYVDGVLADSSTSFTPWKTSGNVIRMQFGSRVGGIRAGEAKNGGLVDDLRIHDAALTPAQIKEIAREYGLVISPDHINIQAAGGWLRSGRSTRSFRGTSSTASRSRSPATLARRRSRTSRSS